MLNEMHQQLKDIQPKKEFFIGIDSDGCAFDTMEIKHKECFCPKTILHWNLQAVSKYAREAWDFVNLYSKSRGCNRFPALLEVLQLLRERKEVQARGVRIPDMTPLVEWTKKESKMGNPTLKKYAAEAKNPIIDTTYRWSVSINEAIDEMVHGIGPFPYMRESLVKLSDKADAMVISQTPVAALTKEWTENDIVKFVRIIAGQEHGKKEEHLKYGAKEKYPDEKILMIGDAPGDLKAAKANGVLFFPINPGEEEKSWQLFHDEALDLFFRGKYSRAYEASLIEKFQKLLPDSPPWKQ